MEEKDEKMEKAMEIVVPYIEEYTHTPTWGNLTFNFENSKISYIRKEKIDKLKIEVKK